VNGQTLSGFLVLCKNRDGYSSMKQMVASLRFLYEQVLRKDIDFDFNIGMKKPSRIPVVLSLEEVERFLNSFTNLKHKAIFTLIY
jgi:site-specific recombinase XerD